MCLLINLRSGYVLENFKTYARIYCKMYQTPDNCGTSRRLAEMESLRTWSNYKIQLHEFLKYCTYELSTIPPTTTPRRILFGVMKRLARPQPHAFALREDAPMGRQAETSGLQGWLHPSCTNRLEWLFTAAFLTPCARQEGCSTTLQGLDDSRLGIELRTYQRWSHLRVNNRACRSNFKTRLSAKSSYYIFERKRCVAGNVHLLFSSTSRRANHLTTLKCGPAVVDRKKDCVLCFESAWTTLIITKPTFTAVTWPQC